MRIMVRVTIALIIIIVVYCSAEYLTDQSVYPIDNNFKYINELDTQLKNSEVLFNFISPTAECTRFKILLVSKIYGWSPYIRYYIDTGNGTIGIPRGSKADSMIDKRFKELKLK